MSKKAASNLSREDALAAREYAFLLLKFRPRTEHELVVRLRKKKFGEALIRETIAFLKEKKFIDDALFASSWLESRLRKPYGLRRVVRELQVKGIDARLIAGSVDNIKANYREDQVVREIAEQKLTSLRGLEPRAVKQRLYGYLVRRGFSGDVIVDIVNQVIKDDDS